jgi:acetyltransferase-like isoleucine patch superfamily enzyme
MIYNSFYSYSELKKFGFISLGENVCVSKFSSIYSPNLISIGNNVRIDDFCILSGNIDIGSYIHISAYTAIYAKFGVKIEDFVTVSGRNLIYSQNDDYSGEYMTNPLIPEKYRKVKGGKIILKKFSIIGAGCIILPNITVGEGCAVGSMSLINRDLEDWKIYAGIPVRYLKERMKNIIELHKEVINNL